MLFNAERVPIDNQIEDGDPELMENRLYTRTIVVARTLGRLCQKVIDVPRVVHNKAIKFMDELDKAVGR